jgi:hypothetical protein
LNQPRFTKKNFLEIETQEDIYERGFLPNSLYWGIHVFSNCLSELYTKIVSYKDNYIDFSLLKKTEAYYTACKEASRFRLIDFSNIRESARTPFFINLHNFIFLHSCSKTIPYDINTRIITSLKEWYMIGKYKISMYDIENYILRRKYPPNDKSYLLDFRVEVFDNRLNFALCNGSISSPLPKVYTEEYFEEEIQESTRRFLSNSIIIDSKTRGLQLPNVLGTNRKDFGYTDEKIIQYLFKNVDEERLKLLEIFFSLKNSEYSIVYEDYNWETYKIDKNDFEEYKEIRFVDMLKITEYREKFKEYSNSEFSIENVLFWEEVQKYKNQHYEYLNQNNIYKKILKESAIKIFEEFLKKGKKINYKKDQNMN